MFKKFNVFLPWSDPDSGSARWGRRPRIRRRSCPEDVDLRDRRRDVESRRWSGRTCRPTRSRGAGASGEHRHLEKKILEKLFDDIFRKNYDLK